MYKKTRRSVLKSLLALPALPLLDRLLALAGAQSTAVQAQGTPNVLMVLFDTMSARDMSLYGYPRETTPNLARLAERATVYHAHYAAGNYTTPGTASLLSGTYPWTHRAFGLRAAVADRVRHQNLFRAYDGTGVNRIAYTHNRIAHVFLNQFRQAIDTLVDPAEFYLLGEEFFEKAFPRDWEIAYRSDLAISGRMADVPASLFHSMLLRMRRQRIKNAIARKYGDRYPRGIGEENGGFFLFEQAIDGIKELVSSSPQPFCAYMHLLPPHWPYNARKDFIGLFDGGWMPSAKERHFFSTGESDKEIDDKRIQYDEFIAHADAEFGRLYDALEQAGVLENTYLILTSDHGELFERGIWGHGTQTLYEPLIHIPLVIFKPQQQQREDVHTLTSCVDLLPTLCHLAGIEIPSWCEGEVLPTFADQQPNPERTVYAVEARSNPAYTPLTKATVSILRQPFKLTHYFGYEGYQDEYELYDLENDPEEMNNLYSQDNPVARELQEELAAKLQQVDRNTGSQG